MAEKQNTQTSPAQTGDAPALPKAGKAIGSITERWEGYSPEQLRPGITAADMEQFDQEDLLGKQLTVYGYNKRSGTYGDFVIVLFSPDGKQLGTFVTGGVVLRRKLAVVAEQGAFPVQGTLKRPEGKRYFDFVS